MNTEMAYLIIGTILALLIYIFVHFRFAKKQPNEDISTLDDIPGPKGIPFLGNLLADFFTTEDQRWDNIRKRALKYYPIYKLKYFNQNVVCLLDPRDVEMVLTDTTNVKGKIYDVLREFAGNGLVVSDGELWRQRRKKITKSFHFSYLSTYINIFNKEIDSLIKQIRNQMMEPIGVLSKMAPLTLKIVKESMVGERSKMDDSEVTNYIKCINTLAKVITFRCTRPEIKILYDCTNLKQKQLEATKTIRNFSSRVYEDSVNVPMLNEENSLRLMNILLKNPELFNTNDIESEIDNFLFAGHDTASSALTFALMVLANYPQYQDEIRQEMVEIGIEDGVASISQLKEMNLLDRFFKECLRLYPPVTFISRTLTKDTITKTGYLLPAGTVVLVHIFDIHRNPNLFPDPLKFDADRFLPDNIQKRHPFAHIPFSAGHRNCVGQGFAKLEVKATICRILDKFILKPVSEIDKLGFRMETILKPKDDIMVKFIPR